MAITKDAMLPRERVMAALNWTGPDRPPMAQSAGNGARAEHGQKLLDLWKRYPSDFDDLSKSTLPDVPADAFSESYYSTATDGWGVVWEYKIYGIAGHPKVRPLDDWTALEDYQPPKAPAVEGTDFEAHRAWVKQHQQTYYVMGGWVNIFETLHAVRRFEDVLLDIADDSEEINRLADMIVEVQEGSVRFMLESNTDGIMFADDWGTALGGIISPTLWRRFFRPRYDRLMAPVRAAGKHIFFHSCGKTEWIWEELADLGVNMIWPQLELVDNDVLADYMQRRKVALFAHPDRARIMPFGTPEEVREEVRRIKRTFCSPEGGVIFQGEVDRGYPFENVAALYDEIVKPLPEK
jgi:uroporphyrinogen decarboxylase